MIDFLVPKAPEHFYSNCKEANTPGRARNNACASLCWSSYVSKCWYFPKMQLLRTSIEIGCFVLPYQNDG